MRCGYLEGGILEDVTDFATSQGRMKFTRPLYRELFNVAKEHALQTFEANQRLVCVCVCVCVYVCMCACVFVWPFSCVVCCVCGQVPRPLAPEADLRLLGEVARRW